ncbi:hypothetical protein GALMADRAFT_65626 [Galerina marginata CBS 339.88]|uniref:Uncharacterized protein n=1 Tax=Galerina marginata (strain CBS 339.88) TaxID=685588 RepID=A0A067T2W7_GALM3|nr:hypothetical protein GALMADRAFT_65626 [Galerina marginata CBS 339.88]
MLSLFLLSLISELPKGTGGRPLFLSDALNASGTYRLTPPPTELTDHRSTTDIIWSCLATIFACTWVALHPNIPGPKEGKARIVLSRIELMFWSIVVPEMILLWALRQRRGARHIAHKYAEYGWTTSHGHFMQMGGFVLVDGDNEVEVLSPNTFDDLFEEQRVGLPWITEKDIQDRSKGDALSKGLVVTQTLWFIAQCVSRRVQHLAITEIELVTLAFGFLNSLMYFLWWEKPQSVISYIRIPLVDSISPPKLIRLPSKGCTEHPTDSREESSEHIPSLLAVNLSLAPPDAEVIVNVVGTIPPSESAEVDQLEPEGTFCHFPRALLYINLVIYRPKTSSKRAETSESKLQRYRMSNPMKMPTFYAFPTTSQHISRQSVENCAVVILVSAIFGLIHCIGWSFAFPSIPERILWRVCAIIITVVPIIAVPWVYLVAGLSLLFRLIILVYLLARLALLGEAFVALRGLPPSAYDVVKWTAYLPHI